MESINHKLKKKRENFITLRLNTHACKTITIEFVKMFSFKASRGYHVYKEASWSNAKMNEEVKVELETEAKSLSTNFNSCAINKSEAFIIYRIENSEICST